MRRARPTGVSFVPGLLALLVVVPALSILIALTTGFSNTVVILPMIVTVVLVRTFVLKAGDHGGLWRILTWVCTGAIAVSSIFLEQAYFTVRAERVDAVVVGEVPNRRLADPATNEDLGEAPRIAPSRERGNDDTVPVLVIRGSDHEPLTVKQGTTARTGAVVWLLSWLAAIGMHVMLTLRRRRQERAGSPTG